MIWTEPAKATQGVSNYDHVISVTPIGKVIIEWKSWKEHPSHDIMIEDKWLGVEYNLDDAKSVAEKYLTNKLNELMTFLTE